MTNKVVFESLGDEATKNRFLLDMIDAIFMTEAATGSENIETLKQVTK